MRLLAFIIAFWPLQSLAEAPLTPEAFEAHVVGKAVTYALHGNIYGVEEYLEGRKVRWSIAPNLCKYGTWYPDGSNICFVYETGTAPHCWTFWLRDGALVAQSTGGGIELQESAISDKGLPCPGPDVGV